MAAMTALLPAGALAAAPTAVTGQATAIGDATATLTGTVNPNKEQTTYHFEYGATTAYGAVTPDQSAGNKNKASSVSAKLTSLAPSTTYHYRLVASNASGTTPGADMTFTTATAGTPPPGGNTVTIAATPASVLFGRATAITGTVVGPDGPGAQVSLEAQPLGGGDFQEVASGTADAAGNYSLGAVPTVNTAYRVVAKTKPPVTSPLQPVKVRIAVTRKVSDANVRRGGRVRFSGTATPAHDGLPVLIQRRTSSGKWRTVAKTALKTSATAGQSKYGKRVRIRRAGFYRVRVPHDADHATGTSRRKRIRVH
jgi:hypothetical protein